LKRGCHKNSLIQDSYDKHGKDFFEFEIMEKCSVENLMKKEVLYVNLFRKSASSLLNLTKGGFGSIGSKRKKSSSKHHGVSRHFYKQKKGDMSYYWRANFSYNGKQKYLGQFKTEIEAAKAVDVESWDKYKDLNKLNFPEEYICE